MLVAELVHEGRKQLLHVSYWFGGGPEALSLLILLLCERLLGLTSGLASTQPRRTCRQHSCQQQKQHLPQEDCKLWVRAQHVLSACCEGGLSCITNSSLPNGKSVSASVLTHLLCTCACFPCCLLQGEEHHLFKLFDITPCEALMRGTLEHNPWLVLELLAQVSGNTLCVLVEGQPADAAVAAAAAAAGSSSKKSKAAGSKDKAAGSKRSSDSGDGVVVVLQPPKQEALWKVVQPPVNMTAGEGQEEGEGDEAGSEASEEEEGDSVFDWFDSDVTSEQGEDAGPAANPLQHAAAAAAAGIDGAAGDGLAAALGRSRVTHLVLKLRNNSWKLLPVTSGICTQPGVGADAAGVHAAGSGSGGSSSSKRRRVSLDGPVSGGSSSTKGRGSGSGSVLQVGVSGPNANYSFCIVCDSREGLVACSTCHVSVCEAHCSSQLTVPMGATWRCTACCKRGK